MKNIVFSDRIKNAAPALKVLQIEAVCSNPATSDALWSEMETACRDFKSSHEISDISRILAIAATRNAYKALGKEPNRYRPSAEALCRRVINGKGLYRLHALIDIINIISVKTGYSIGGFDCDKIAGDTLTLDSGRHEEPFNAIGRGPLNIENLPVYRDEKGGIGTPTSDEERTKLTPATTRLLMLVNMYEEDTDVESTLEMARNLLTRHAGLKELSYGVAQP